MAAGFALLIAGAVLSVPGVPGPRILVILLGLWLLRDHFAWARKSLAWCKRRLARLRRSSGLRRRRVPVGVQSASDGAAD